MYMILEKQSEGHPPFPFSTEKNRAVLHSQQHVGPTPQPSLKRWSSQHSALLDQTSNYGLRAADDTSVPLPRAHLSPRLFGQPVLNSRALLHPPGMSSLRLLRNWSILRISTTPFLRLLLFFQMFGLRSFERCLVLSVETADYT